MRVVVPTRFMANLVDRRFGPALRRAIEDELGSTGSPVRFSVDEAAFRDDKTPAKPGPSGRSDPSPPRSPGRGASSTHGRSDPNDPPDPRSDPSGALVGESSSAAGPDTGRNSPFDRGLRRGRLRRYELSDFVVGQSNRLAYSAAVSLACGEAHLSPLFIHGGCGLGKTHLLQGIANQFRRAHRGARVRCITAEAFTNEYLGSMRAGTLEAFRSRYRAVDLLCLDDVHILSTKKATQNELLHTFDAIDLRSRLVALASDEHPREIDKLGAGLISRFMSGAVIRLDPPDPELRERMIAQLALRRALEMDHAAIALMGEHAARAAARAGLTPSVRDLEGMLARVEAMHRLAGGGTRRVGAALVSKALGQIGGPGGASGARRGRPRRPVRVQAIMQLGCATLGVTIEELMGKGRHKRVVLTRAVTVLLARELTNHSYPEIARAMGRPNHSTVITAHKRITGQIERHDFADIGPEFDGLTVEQVVGRVRSQIEKASA